jgi:hypothetical protein
MDYKAFPAFLGPSNTLRANMVNDEDLVCFFLEKSPRPDFPFAMYGTAGLEDEVTFADAGAGRIRGALGLNDYVVVVSGGLTYIRDFATDTWSLIPGDQIADNGYPVQMAANKTQIFIVGGGKGYIVQVGTVTQIADPDFPGNVAGQIAIGAVNCDDYFITIGKSTVAAEASLAKFYISSLSDGTLWDSLEFGSIPSSANSLVGLLEDHRKLWVFGTNKSQVFFNSGNLDFPFEPDTAGVIDQGLVNVNAVASMQNTPWWLGVDTNGKGIPWRANGYLPLKVSTPAIDTVFAGYDTSDAIVWTCQLEGHDFIVFTFPTSGKTWAYNASMPTDLAWFQWPHFDSPTTQAYQAHRGSCHAFQDGIHFIGDRALPKMYRMSMSVYTDAGATIRRVRRFANIVESLDRVFYAGIRFDMQQGVGLLAGQGSAPTLLFRWSDDGGNNWSDYLTLTVGAIGDYGPLVTECKRLGQGRNRVFEIVCTDPVFWAFGAAWLAARKGTS